MRTAEYSWGELAVRYRVLPAEPDVGIGSETVEILEITGPDHAPLTHEQVQALEWAGVIDQMIEAIETEELG